LRHARAGLAAPAEPDSIRAFQNRRRERTPQQKAGLGMGILKEFQEFAVKGNVLDMAVGIIIGGAFGTIVKSLVDDVIMPPIGAVIGGIDFSNLALTVRSATETSDAVVIKYGAFINNVISFLVVAWVVFMLVKAMNTFKKKQAAAAPAAPPADVVLLGEIRDLLKAGR
jgi:large conductance mechanosensitive channel